MAVQNEADLIAGYFPDEPAKPEFEPIGVTPRFRPAGAKVDPDTGKGWIRRMLPVVFHHRYLVIGSLVAALLAMLVQVAIPALIGATIDKSLLSRAKPLSYFVYLLVALGIARGVLTYLYRYGMSRITFTLEYDLRTIIFDHLTKLSFSFYDKVQSGQVIARANSDIRSVQRFLAQVPMMGMSLLTFVTAFIYMLSLHVGLTLVAVFCLPGVYFVSRRMRRIMFPLSWLVQSRLAELMTIVDENINGVRVVKSFAAELLQIKLLARAAEALRWANIETVKLRARLNPIISNLPKVGLAFVIFYGGYLAIEDRVTIGDLVAFSSYVVMIQAPFRMLGMLLVRSERAKASAKRIYEILDERSDIVESPTPVDLTDPKGGIAFRDVTFSYAEGPAILQDFSLAIEPGEAVAIVGRTGSGKSTITRLLTRFYDVSAGGVYIDGRDIRDLSTVSLRANVGMVLDEPFLFSTSLRANITYGRPKASMDEIAHAAEAAGAHGFIRDLPDSYDTVIGERGYTLSGGQRQRVAIARTLLTSPAILVLDDATSSVDVQVEARIHEALKELMKDRTTIIIAHRLSTIMLADRVVLVEGGKVVASDTHANLMLTEPRYVEVLARAEEERKADQEAGRSEAPGLNPVQEPMEMELPDDPLPPDTDTFGGTN